MTVVSRDRTRDKQSRAPEPDTHTRIMITSGMTVPFVAIYVDIRPDDIIEVLSVDFDRD